MFKRRSKAAALAADTNTTSGSGKNGSAIAVGDNNNGDAAKPPIATSGYGVTPRTETPEAPGNRQQQQGASTIFDDDSGELDVDDESVNGLQRMKRNLTVSRSGRYKSKSRPRPAVSSIQAPAVVSTSSSVVPGQSCMVPSVMATGGSNITSGFGATSGLPPSGSSTFRGQPSAPRGLSTAL